MKYKVVSLIISCAITVLCFGCTANELALGWDISKRDVEVSAVIKAKNEQGKMRTSALSGEMQKIEGFSSVIGLWFFGEDNLIIQDMAKFYRYNIPKSKIVAKLDTDQMHILSVARQGGKLMCSNKSVDFDINMKTLKTEDYRLHQETQIPRYYSADKKTIVYRADPDIAVENSTTGDKQRFDTFWTGKSNTALCFPVGFADSDTVLYMTINIPYSQAFSNDQCKTIGVLRVDGSLHKEYFINAAISGMGYGRVILSDTIHGIDAETGVTPTEKVYTISAPDYDLKETSVPNFGEFALSADNEYIVNLKAELDNSFLAKDGFQLSIYDFETCLPVRNKIYSEQISVGDRMAVSDSASYVAFNNTPYGGAEAVYLYSAK